MKNTRNSEPMEAQAQNDTNAVRENESTFNCVPVQSRPASTDPSAEKRSPMKERAGTPKPDSASKPAAADKISDNSITAGPAKKSKRDGAAEQNPTDGEILREGSPEPNNAIDEFINAVPDIYLIRAEEIVNCRDDEAKSLAVQTVCSALNNEESAKVLIAIAAHRLLKSTPAQSGGAGNEDVLKQGRMSVLAAFSESCLKRGKKISVKTLYKYIRRIDVLIEEPLRQMALDGTESSVIEQERIDRIKCLFALPEMFFRAKHIKIKPIETHDAPDEGNATHEPRQFENSNGNKNDCARADETTVREDVSRPASPEAAIDREELAPRLKANPIFGIYSPEEALYSELKREADRLNAAPESVKTAVVKILQTMLSVIQTMEVEK